MKLPILLPAILTFLPFACVLSAAEPQTADAKLDAFFRKYLEDCFAFRPLEATQLGDRRFDDRLDDLSAAARQRWRDHYRQALDDLPRAIDYEQLSASGKVDFEILQHELTRALWLSENTSPYEQDPRVYSGYISDSIFLLLTQSTLPKEKNIANAIVRMAHIPEVVAAARENLQSFAGGHRHGQPAEPRLDRLL